MFKKIRLIILVTLLISISLTGCYDAIEIDDEIYALVIGIDKGIDNKIILTIQYPTYKSSSGGSEESGKKGVSGQSSSNLASGSIIHSIEAETILEGINMFGMAISRRVSLMHAKMIVISEASAKEGVKSYIAPLRRFRETRTTMNIVVVKGKAEDFIKEISPNIGDSLAKTIELMSNQSKNTSFFPEAMFINFYKGMLSPYESAIAVYGGINNFDKLPSDSQNSNALQLVDNGYLPGDLPRKGVAKREFVGMAVFNEDKMVGSLDSYETRYYLLVMGKYKKGIMTIEDKEMPSSTIAIDMRIGRSPQISSHFENGKPVIDVKLQIEGDIVSIQSRINYEKLSKLNDLDSQISGHIKNEIQKLIKKTQTEFKADIFGFGHKVAGEFLTIQEWEEYNWLSHYPEAKVNVDVEVNIRRTGLMIYSAPIADFSSETDKKEEE